MIGDRLSCLLILLHSLKSRLSNQLPNISPSLHLIHFLGPSFLFVVLVFRWQICNCWFVVRGTRLLSRGCRVTPRNGDKFEDPNQRTKHHRAVRFRKVDTMLLHAAGQKDKAIGPWMKRFLDVLVTGIGEG